MSDPRPPVNAARVPPSRANQWRFIVRSLTVVLFVLLLVAVLAHRDRTYTLTATTETASVIVRDPRGIAVRLPRATLWDPGSPAPAATPHCCAITLEARDGVRLVLSEKRRGDLLIQVGWPQSGSGGANLIEQDGTVLALHNGQTLQVPLSHQDKTDPAREVSDTVLVAFRGEARVGDDVAPLVERTLLSGSVKVVEATLLRHERYVVSEATLDPGDSVTWRKTDEASPQVVAGFIRAGSSVSEGLQVTAHAAADHLQVERFGAAAYDIKPSLFDRLAHDPFLSLIVSFILSFIGLYDLLAKPWQWKG